MAEFDLPAMLAESLRVSGRETLTYIGHSQGTMMMFAKGTDPEVARMVSLFIALAPVAWLRDTTAPLVHGISKFPKLDWLISLLGLQEFDVRAVPHVACSYLPFLCDVTICAMAGCEGGMTTEMTELLADHFPDLTSWQNLEHYQQAVLSNTFRRFDYGTPTLNQKAYGSPTPPSYTFDNWNVSSSLFFGGRDTLADPTDVAKLIPKLPANRTEVTYLPNYGHGSFVWNQRAHVEIYPTIVEKAIAASPDGKYAVRRARPASRKMLGPVVFGGERLVPGGATGAEQ
jgi:lysosomal acid lipase/cholesteryl ester hydrolase